MTTDKVDQYITARREEIRESEYSDECADAILTFLDAYNPDYLGIEPPIRDGKDSRENTLATSSRLAYASTLHRTAQHLDLTTCTSRDLNRLASERMNGSHESVGDDGVSRNTVHQNQIAWRSFAQFHESHPKGYDIEMDPETITLVDREETSVDERDMFDSDEIEAMRDACQNKRDRAVLEMLIYTGQRHAALRLLTVQDVQPHSGESGVLYIPEGEGMKGAEGKRPLLGAQKAAREWKEAHPTGNPDDAFFTHIYDWSGHDKIEPGDHLSHQTFADIPKRIADRANVEKKANPHQFRHYFCQMAITKHDMSFDTIRHLLGHAEGSRELERTYQHLVDDDYIESAEIHMGIQDGHDESLTPPQCTVCNEPLEPSWSICPNCEAVYGPDAERMEDEIAQRTTEDALDATTAEEREEIELLIELVDDPATMNQLVALSRLVEEDELEDISDTLG